MGTVNPCFTTVTFLRKMCPQRGIFQYGIELLFYFNYDEKGTQKSHNWALNIFLAYFTHYQSGRHFFSMHMIYNSVFGNEIKKNQFYDPLNPMKASESLFFTLFKSIPKESKMIFYCFFMYTKICYETAWLELMWTRPRYKFTLCSTNWLICFYQYIKTAVNDDWNKDKQFGYCLDIVCVAIKLSKSRI